MTSVLSPLAEVFHPHCFTPEVNTIIYNDGIPSCSFSGSSSEFLHGIADETIDDAYPPSAEEAAELEAVEVFVDLLATLAVLEDREEAIRSADHAGLEKRWHSRRELVDRPRPARHSIQMKIHTAPMKKNSMITDLVLQEQQARAAMRLREQEMARVMMGKAYSGGKHMNAKGGAKLSHKPIQQPRKHC